MVQRSRLPQPSLQSRAAQTTSFALPASHSSLVQTSLPPHACAPISFLLPEDASWNKNVRAAIYATAGSPRCRSALDTPSSLHPSPPPFPPSPAPLPRTAVAPISIAVQGCLRTRGSPSASGAPSWPPPPAPTTPSSSPLAGRFSRSLPALDHDRDFPTNARETSRRKLVRGRHCHLSVNPQYPTTCGLRVRRTH